MRKKISPTKSESCRDLVLSDSPLGKTVGGAHPDLFEEIDVAAYEPKTPTFCLVVEVVEIRSKTLSSSKWKAKSLEKGLNLLTSTPHFGILGLTFEKDVSKLKL